MSPAGCCYTNQIPIDSKDKNDKIHVYNIIQYR